MSITPFTGISSHKPDHCRQSMRKMLMTLFIDFTISVA